MLGAVDEKAPAFGGKRGAMGEKAGDYFLFFVGLW